MTTTAHPRAGAPVPPLPSQTAPEPPPYLLAGLVVLGVLILYIVTLAPTTQFWDTSEYIAAAYVLGIPHPPGNPLFVMVAHVWGDVLAMVGHYAARINLFAATTSAVAAGCWFLVGERWMRAFVPARGPRRLAAVAGALVGATAFTVWNQSVVNEKVYTVSLLSIALVLWLIVRWDDQPEGQAHDHYLLVIVYLLALTSTNHMMGVLVGPVVALLLFPPFKTRRPAHSEARAVEWAQWAVFCAVLALLLASGMESSRIIAVAAFFYVAALVWAAMAKKWGFALVMLGVAAVGVSVYVFLPIRAAHFPPINEGEPTTWDALWSVLTREQYGKLPVSQRQSTIVAQVQNWLQYFSWQFGRDLSGAGERVVAVLFGALGLTGAWRHWRADKRSAAAMTVLVLTLTALLIFYLNFKYGYSLYRDRFPDPDLHEVRERDYFYIASFAVWGIWVGMGLATLMEWVRDFLQDRVPDDRRRWSLATPVLALALIPLLANYRSASRAGETLARDFAVDLLNSVEPYGILVTAGDNDTFPLWYAQEVEHIRQDVTVVNLSLANTDWYLRQLQRRPLADFDSAAAPAIYRGRAWPKPTSRLMSFTEQELATLNLFYIVERPTGVALGPIAITLDPERMGRTYVERADVAVLQIIKDHLGKRPIYFSRTVGDYAERLDLEEYVEGHGFARVLRERPVTPSDSVVNVTVLGMVNLPRTRALLFDVYHYDAAARPRPRGWVDRPSEGILTTYGLLYQAISLPLRERDPALAQRALAIADSIFRNTEIALLAPGRQSDESRD
jgi:hypothetical protein